MRPFRRWMASVGIALLLLPWAGLALAHIELEEASPAPGESLSRSPERAVLVFSEELAPGANLVLFGRGFNRIQGVETSQNPARDRELIATIPLLEPGDYTVHYEAVGLDGHLVSGSYTFRVEAGPSTFRLWPFGLALVAVVGIGLVWRRGRRYA